MKEDKLLKDTKYRRDRRDIEGKLFPDEIMNKVLKK